MRTLPGDTGFNLCSQVRNGMMRTQSLRSRRIFALHETCNIERNRAALVFCAIPETPVHGARDRVRGKPPLVQGQPRLQGLPTALVMAGGALFDEDLFASCE